MKKMKHKKAHWHKRKRDAGVNYIGKAAAAVWRRPIYAFWARRMTMTCYILASTKQNMFKRESLESHKAQNDAGIFFFSINLRRNKLCEREINEMARWNEGGNKGRESQLLHVLHGERELRSLLWNAQIWGWMTFLLPYFSVFNSSKRKKSIARH